MMQTVFSQAERSDEDLLAGLKAREIGALEALYDRHHRLALALATRIVGDREGAEEVVQETFLAVWRQADSYRPDRGGARGWILSIARHRAIDRIRRGRAFGTLAELPESIEDQRVPEAWQVASENLERERVLSALSGLPVEQRETVELAYYGGLTHAEIAQRLDLPLGTVKGRLRLAMDKLRLALADLAPDRGGTA